MTEINRKLAAIMFTDMVGFTSLMQKDENSGLQKRARHKEVIEKTHKKYKGEIIQYFGDGTLSIFNNSIDAVNCAIAIQKDLKEPVEVPLRIGIHAGNIVVEKDGIIGDAVNIASRIESFANIGGVLISDAVHEQVRNQDYDRFVLLGKFNLKNIDRQFEIFAVADDGITVPSPDHLKGKGERAIVTKNDIPISASPILGREEELIDLTGLLLSNQVVTITGTGGMGKTRVSIETGRRLQSNYPGGVVFISLATQPNEAGLLPTLASALDVKEASGRSLNQGIASIISNRKVLLILDNLEHIRNAGKEIAELVSHCPELRILCTSRSPLKIKAEQEYPLRTLPLPRNVEFSTLLNYPAIELFVSQAQKVDLNFGLTKDNAEDVAAICQRMDGLPLALELAAARIRILPPDKLLKRLGKTLDILTSGSNDLPERHQTLRNTINWSYSLLNEPEKQLFRRLAVFTGGFTLEAIEEVCYIDQDAALLALDELESLCEKGLVQKLEGGSRFIQLQTIKDFALEKLNQHNEKDEWSQKHASFFSKFSLILSRGTYGEMQLERLKLGFAEDSNIQTALDYLLQQAELGDEKGREMGLAMCGDLWMYWHIKGWNISTRNYCNAFLNSSQDQTPTIGKSKAMMGLSVAYWMLGEYDKCLSQALLHKEVAAEIENDLEIGKSKLNLVCGYLFNDLKKSKTYAEEAEKLFMRLDEPYWLGLTSWFQGNIFLMAGDLPAARSKYSRSLELTKTYNDYEHKGGSLGGLALIEFLEGNLERSIQLYEDSLEAYSTVGDIAEVARILSEMSWAYLAVKDTNSARRYTQESIEAYQKVGSPRGVGLSMIGLAAIETVEGRSVRAIVIASAAERFAEKEGIVNVYGDSNQGKIYIDQARSNLSDTVINMAKIDGAKLSLEEVLEISKSEVIQFL